MKYRPEIDGLRAVAVTSVILAHAGVSFLQGGFVGVDVFFVISGYLITKIIYDGMQAGKFSLVNFYERRARRILPALIVVIAVTSIAAWHWMLPDFLENYGQSIVGTLVFANNVVLALTSGYWDLESSFKPLLHTWSLGVEEQFYIVFPLLMLLLRKVSRRTLIVILVLLAILSLIFAQVGVLLFSSSNFYLPFGRAWELLVGCICALGRFDVSEKKAAVLSGGALIAILGSILFLPDHTPAPSFYLLPAVVGTGLVILYASLITGRGAC